MNSNFIEFPFLPITEETFERQGWEKITEHEEGSEGDDSNTFTYWILPLPKDNPDEECAVLISSAEDDYKELGLKKGEFVVEIADFFALGICTTEEELEILYRSLTKEDIE
jgi:hypothetical protein